MPQVRAAALTCFHEVACFVGLDPDALLHDAGLDSRDLSDPDRQLPVDSVAGLLEEAARLSGCEHFGLLMAESRSLASIGPVSLLLRHQPRVGDVVESIVRYQRLYGNALHLELGRIDDATVLRVEVSGSAPTFQAVQLLLGYFCRCVAAVIERPWHPESVHFTHPAPADTRAYRRIFACPVDFGAAFNGFVCANEALVEPNPASDEEMVGHAERLMRLLAPAPGERTTSERVRQSLRLLLPDQHGTIDRVAGHLALTPRSLQRLLDREGTSFGALLNEVRRELAQRLLSTRHEIASVASMSGFERPSSFTRWFSGEFGMAPSAWRREARASAAAH